MKFTVQENKPLTATVYRMTLRGDTRALLRPGQFVQLQLPGFYLRRPFSVYDWSPAERGCMTLVYKTVGRGTEAMTRIPVGATLDALVGLGNGFITDDIPAAAAARAPLLIGGGVGVLPLYGLCRRLLLQGQRPAAVLGFNTREEVILRADFEALGIPVTVATVDGSEGVKGFVTDAVETLAAPLDYVYTCGPEPMLRAVHALCGRKGVGGQFSFEERMGCGFGACMGCTCETVTGGKRICKEGPVLVWEEILWQTRG